MRSYPEWLRETLNAYSPDEISKGVEFTRPSRRRRKDGTYGKYFTQHQVAKGTGLKKSTVKRLQDLEGIAKPTKKTLEKLRAFHRRTSYQILRSRGASQREAYRLSKGSTKSIAEAKRDFDKYVKIIAKNKGVPEKYIRFGISRSTHSKNYWDTYTKQKGFLSPADLPYFKQWQSKQPLPQITSKTLKSSSESLRKQAWEFVLGRSRKSQSLFTKWASSTPLPENLSFRTKSDKISSVEQIRKQAWQAASTHKAGK